MTGASVTAARAVDQAGQPRPSPQQVGTTRIPNDTAPKSAQKRSHGNRIAWLLALLLTTGFTSPAPAQDCATAAVPFQLFTLPDGQRGIGSDSSVVPLLALPPDAVEGDGVELYVFNPFTGMAVRQTFGTRAEVEPRTGLLEPFTRRIVSMSADSTRVILSPSAVFGFPVDPLTGMQFTQLAGVPGVAVEFDLRTGLSTPIDLPTPSISPGQVLLTQITGASRDHRRLSYTLYVLELGENGRVTNFVSEDVGIFDSESRTTFDPLTVIGQAIGRNPDSFPFFGDVSAQISGDGRAYVFLTQRNLLHPQDISWSETPGNNFGVSQAAYWFNFDTQELRILGEPDISQVRVPVRNLFDRFFTIADTIFIRNVGFTGRVIPFDRSVPFIDLPNPTGQPAVAVISLDAPPRFVRPPQEDPRGPFSIRGGYISDDDRTIYFQSAEPLVAGLNVSRTTQLFSYDIATGNIRQISQFQDDVFSLLQNSPEILVGTGSNPQRNFRGASADRRVVLMSGNVIPLTAAVGSGSGLRLSFSSTNVSATTESAFVCEEAL